MGYGFDHKIKPLQFRYNMHKYTILYMHKYLIDKCSRYGYIYYLCLPNIIQKYVPKWFWFCRGDMLEIANWLSKKIYIICDSYNLKNS